MSIIQTFIGDICGENNANNHIYCWICVAIVISGILICLAIRMVLQYFKEKQMREEELELKVLANIEKKEKHIYIENKLSEICKILNEIRSKVETLS